MRLSVKRSNPGRLGKPLKHFLPMMQEIQSLSCHCKQKTVNIIFLLPNMSRSHADPSRSSRSLPDDQKPACEYPRKHQEAADADGSPLHGTRNKQLAPRTRAVSSGRHVVKRPILECLPWKEHAPRPHRLCPQASPASTRKLLQGLLCFTPTRWMSLLPISTKMLAITMEKNGD